MRRIEPKKEVKVQSQPTIVLPEQDMTAATALTKTQIEATLALTEVAAMALDKPDIKGLIQAILDSNVKSNKKLTINRDHNGLIDSINIEEV